MGRGVVGVLGGRERKGEAHAMIDPFQQLLFHRRVVHAD